MPQLVKGGKWVFGITLVNNSGSIIVPPDAVAEYGFVSGERLVAMDASKTSGGFVLCRPGKLLSSRLTTIIEAVHHLLDTGESMITTGTRTLVTGVFNHNGAITLPLEGLLRYSVKPGGRLVVGRGSNTGLSFLARGPIVAEAMRHPELPVFECA